MPTKVFISWSGDQSRQLAEALRTWLPAVLQFVKPYFTPDDIEKGAKWNTDITKELETSDIGLICLTRDNTDKPWILFEAGALSKSFEKARVCTLLFGLDPADLKGPLTSFQHTRFNETDFKRLVASINSSAGDAKLDSAVLNTVFEMWWRQLEEQIGAILRSGKAGVSETRRPDRDILEEILELSRMNSVRAHRPSRVSPHALRDLMVGVQSLEIAVAQGNAEQAFRTLRELELPLRHLCFESGRPELFEEYRIASHGPLPPDMGPTELSVEQRQLDPLMGHVRVGRQAGGSQSG